NIDFSLIDVALLVPMKKLNRIFDRHYMAGSGPVYVVNHRGQRRGLARPGRSGYQDQSASFIGDLFDDRRQAELLNGPGGSWNHAEHNADGAALLEHIAPEAAQSGNAVGDVYLSVLAEPLLLPIVHDRKRHRDGVLGRQPLGLDHWLKLATNSYKRETARL